MRKVIIKLVAQAHWAILDEDGRCIDSGQANPAALHYPYTEGIQNYLKAVENEKGKEEQ